MAAQELLEDPPEEPLHNSKKWIFKVSIHCEGCKRKVKKILSQVEGVHEIEIDTKQQKVTVTGNVDGDTLLRKLNKSGKHAEIWPENSNQKEKKPAKSTNKKEKVVVPSTSRQETAQPVVNVDKDVKPTPVKAEAAAQEPPKVSEGGRAENNNGGEGGGVAKVGGAGKTTTLVEESGTSTMTGSLKGSGDHDVAKETKADESEAKKVDSGSGGAQPQTVAAEKEGGESEKNASVIVGKVGGSNDGGVSGKKKKKKGQSGNKSVSEQQSNVVAENEGSGNHESGAPNVSTQEHYSRPRHHPMYDHYPPEGPQQQYYYYGPQGPPPAAAPMYATVSYNTAYPSSSYTASYYAAAPPNSYVYSYPGGPGLEGPPPSGFDTYAERQPLDSFEMFSDENPNGCWIM